MLTKKTDMASEIRRLERFLRKSRGADCKKSLELLREGRAHARSLLLSLKNESRKLKRAGTGVDLL